MEPTDNASDAPAHAVVTPFEEHRVKVISLDSRFLIDVLNWWRNPPHWMALIDELPDDCVVVNVNVSWERRCIEAMVASASFPICPEGALPERIPGILTEMRNVPFESV